jgi:tRNA A-37 threonylcarbamoyl transferase component Bud32
VKGDASSSSSHIAHFSTGAGVALRLEGVIDETFDRSKFSAGLHGKVVVVDLDKVRRITSFGVREWVGAVSALAAKYLGFANCRPALVSQMNMVRGFTGRGQLVSLYLPYACTSCGENFEKLIDLRNHHAEIVRMEVPVAVCPKCSAVAELDDVPESYLSFAASQPMPTPPASFDGILNGATPTGATGLKLTKQVEGKWTGLWLEGDLDGRDHFKRAAADLEGPLLVSMRALRQTSDDGLKRLLEFFNRVQVPLVLESLPLQAAEALAAADPAHVQGLSVLSVRAAYSCPTHGEVRLSVPVGELLALGLECECGKEVSPAFDPRAGATVSKLKQASATPELESLLLIHASAPENTPTELAVPTAVGTGSLVMGRYLLQRQLGAGGMAEVFLARQSALGGFEKLVVVKRILPHLANDELFVEMFLSEARIAARINHPNVVQILDVGREGSQYFIIMEYVTGSDLNSLLKRAAAAKLLCPVGVAGRIAASMAQGLEAAHSYRDESGAHRPVIHRDVSPHNVLVSTDGHVKLTDFGIAKAADSRTNTPTQVVKGKTLYLAPELLSGEGKATPLVDVFAAGVVLYQALTGVHPFRRESEPATVAAILIEEAAPPSKLRPDIPPALDAIVAQALAKQPAARFQSARQMAAALELFISTQEPLSMEQLAAWVESVGAAQSDKTRA